MGDSPPCCPKCQAVLNKSNLTAEAELGELDDENMTALQDLLSKVKSKRISSVISAAIRAEADGDDEGMSGLSSDSASLTSVATQWETLYTRATPFLLQRYLLHKVP